MKLLFDQNLSPKLVDFLDSAFPGSDHVFFLGLDEAEDNDVWQYAKEMISFWSRRMRILVT